MVRVVSKIMTTISTMLSEGFDLITLISLMIVGSNENLVHMQSLFMWLEEVHKNIVLTRITLLTNLSI